MESLEQRQMMAGDMELLFTDGVDVTASDSVATQTSSGLQTATQAEGEAAPDLVQFAKDLDAAGVVFYGAHWCPACTAQKELFDDGKNDLPFVEVTNPDRSLNATGTAEGITEFPTWDFPNGTRLVGVQTLATLSATANVPIPSSDQPTFEPIGNQTVLIGSPLHIPVDAYDPGGGPLTVTVSVADPTLVEATVLSGNRSIRIDMNGYGDMVFELFEQRAPVASGRVADLADAGFYDGIIFHRVVDDFVIQAGDPTGTGTSGSTLGNFDDDFHPDLQHNREGVLSFAKSSDDTNNSQFFVTETPTRFLDFNHSIFGQLVEGFDVREAISETAVNNSQQNKPINDVTINTIDVFDDTENGVVMLKAIGNQTGTTTATFTVTDADGNSFSETITVTVAADTVNSQPYLTPIASPVAAQTGQAATLQLGSIDVEGDSVFYTARRVSGANTGTVSVNSATGMVTVTPAAGYTGPIVVDVGVSDSAVTSSQTPDDNQRITFEVSGENVVAAPAAVDLQTASDSGSSNIDNITNAGTLSFRVSAVTNGATVELINTATGSVVGTGVAAADTVVITTNNIAALGDGTYPIAARQRVGDTTSALSPAITLVYDSTMPASVAASAATQANAGRPYVADLISPEEGSGLVYALTSSPAGATINATTGVINWTPTTAQVGNQSFGLSLTDRAGNVRTESFSVSVSGAPQAEIKLEVTDLQGNVISSIATGQEFFLNFIGVDARQFNQPGVYAAYADILFDSNLIRPVPGSSIQYDSDFTVAPKGSFSSGLIDEIGAAGNRIVASNESESLIATVRMEALASGTVNIRSEPADETDSDVLIFGNDDRVPAGTVAYGSVALAIGQTFTVVNDTVTVAEDSAARTVNVLANDTVVSGTGSLSVVAVTQPASGGTVTLTGGVVRFTPAANFSGNTSFTYRVSDSGGVQEDGTVNVTVTAVNDPPTAANDALVVQQGSADNTLDVLANDSFAPDAGETLTITRVGNSSTSTTTTAGGTVRIIGGNVVYTPAAGFAGNDSFTYTISDGTLTDQATVNVTVESSDDPPTAVADAFTVVEDAAEAVFDVRANDTRDADNQTFVLSSVGTPSQGGAVRIGSDGQQFFYQPAANFAGTETVTYTIRDTGGGLSTGTVTFTVTPVNDAPLAPSITVPINRGGATEFVVYSISDLPANVDSGETLSFTNVAATTSEGGTTRVDSTTGRIFYTPPSTSFVGTDTITYSVTDSSLTSSGTLTINVADFTRRELAVLVAGIDSNSFYRLTIEGTDDLNTSVNQAATLDDGQYVFDVLPGSYTVNVPAIPFLQNGSEPLQITIESEPSDGNQTFDVNLGSLKPQFISLQDWLGEAPRKSLLVAVAPNQTSVMVTPSAATDTIRDAEVELDSAGTNLTIRGNATNPANQQLRAVQASVSAVNNRNVQFRGEVDGLRLYRINVQANGVTFAPTTTTTTTTSGGSSAAASIQAVEPVQADAPETQAAAPEKTVDAADGTGAQSRASSSLSMGEVQAEGESLLASAVSVTDTFVPDTIDGSTRSSATVLALDDGDLWIDQSLVDLSPAQKVTDVSTVDSAMEDVAETLTIQSRSADGLASEQILEIDAVDQLLSDQQ